MLIALHCVHLNGNCIEILWDDSVLFLKIQLNHVPLLFNGIQFGLQSSVDCAITVSVLLHSPLKVSHHLGFSGNPVELKANTFTSLYTRYCWLS